MKKVLFTGMLCLATLISIAQTVYTDSAKVSRDSIRANKRGIKGAKFSLENGEGDKMVRVNDTAKHSSKAPGFSAGLTFSRFDLGLTTLIDNGSFTLSPQNQFLRYRSWKSSNVGFDVLQFGYRFTSSFKIYLSGGFDWTLLRLRENVTILPDQPTLVARPDNINYSKNRFSSSYLRIPLSFDFRSNEDSKGKRVHFVIGPDAGILLNGRVKQISSQNGKQKFDDDYHLAKIRYGGFVRLGYDGWGFFAKYYVNDMFENSPEQNGLKNFAFGLTFGF